MTSTHTLALEALPPLEDARYGDNARLARRIRTGDQAAFRELAEGHQSRICWVIARIVHNRQDAEEIAQEVFAKVYFSIRSFAGRSSLFNWIYRMAVNECYAHLRKKRVELVFEADEPAADPGSAADERPAADRVLIQRDFVSKLLARLSKEDRVLLLWKEVEGLSVAQLAAMTGQNENTIKVRLFRARRRLADVAARVSRRRPFAGVTSRV